VPIRLVGIDALVVAGLAPALLPRLRPGSERFAALDPDAVFLNAAAERRLGADATTLTLQTSAGRRSLRIAGTVAAGGPPLAVIDIAGAQALLGSAGRISRIDIRLAPGADRATTLAACRCRPGVRVADAGEAGERISNVSRAYRVNMTVLALVAMFTGAFLVFSILALSVAQRAQPLALLAVLGLTARQRLGLVLADRPRSAPRQRARHRARHRACRDRAAAFGGDLGGGYFPASRRHCASTSPARPATRCSASSPRSSAASFRRAPRSGSRRRRR
jgi:putative ABC transport system permease protein